MLNKRVIFHWLPGKIITFCLIMAIISGCENVYDPIAESSVTEEVDMLNLSISSAPVTEEVPFFAIALCKDDIGMDIRFGGVIERTTHTTTDRTGKTHQSVQFRAKGLLGWIMPETVFDATTVDYEVQGGAEMFNFQKDAEGNNVVMIHEGLLVFDSLTENSSVVAHHTIKMVPGNTNPVNSWSCRLR